MKHTEIVRGVPSRGSKSLATRSTGRFYTPEIVGRRLAEELAAHVERDGRAIDVVDPFGGDGRLLAWFLESCAKRALRMPSVRLTCWDIDRDALATAKQRLETTMGQLGVAGTVEVAARDSFDVPLTQQYDFVITNPPWETLKPDARELAAAGPSKADQYKKALEEYDAFLKTRFPLSQPARKFSGWGTNLSRPGVELAVRLTRADGICGYIAPASLLADQGSAQLRRWLLDELHWLTLWHFPAEARCFDTVDCAFVVATCSRRRSEVFDPVVTRFNANGEPRSTGRMSLSLGQLASIGHVIPLEASSGALSHYLSWAELPTIGDLEGDHSDSLWLGRELDETRRETFLVRKGRYGFLKGKAISRFFVEHPPTEFVDERVRRIPLSVAHRRIAWRDVSRRSQRRRVHAAIVPAGVVTGNSLHVGYFRDDNAQRLEALLGLLNSFCVEGQIRSFLATGHVSLSVVRLARIPELTATTVKVLARETRSTIQKHAEHCALLEVAVAQAFGLSRDAFGAVLDDFPLSNAEREHFLDETLWKRSFVQTNNVPNKMSTSDIVIPNHFSAKLSELDIQTAVAVPPGGNWKNIPVTVPSKRLATIRESFKAGEGSRSTYYGRLRADAPSYTINTYFSRPGNGCHLHYDYDGGQHRVISEREAARLQSFPDSFRFFGSHSAIAKQIGNAVPPLLAYQVAQALGTPGQTVDLFCGAGGLSLGFTWAGWKPLTANDIDAPALRTYGANVHNDAVEGSIREREVFDELVRRVEAQRERRMPIALLGGPPCQGFSTAGKPRSMDDERNQLFQSYREMLERLRPDLFVFENVTGLLNMEGGRVFEVVKSALTLPGYQVAAWKLRAENYGVPQRRTRVFIVGFSKAYSNSINPPVPITDFGGDHNLFDRLTPAVTAEQALGDLPPLRPGEDGSTKAYLNPPSNWYQELMRGVSRAEQYIRLMTPRETDHHASSVSSRAART